MIKITEAEFKAAQQAMRDTGSIEVHSYKKDGRTWNNFYSMKCDVCVWSSSEAGVNKEFFKAA